VNNVSEASASGGERRAEVFERASELRREALLESAIWAYTALASACDNLPPAATLGVRASGRRSVLGGSNGVSNHKISFVM
jgi:hypothetical protein